MPEAREGSAAHEVAARVVRGVEIDLVSIASKWGVDQDELGFLYGRILKAVGELRKWLPVGEAESRLDGRTTKGTADWICSDDHIVIVDWKMGRVERDPWNQLQGYALAAIDELSGAMPGRTTCIAAYPRLGTYEVRHYSIDELEAFRKRVEDAVEKAGAVWSPGDACRFCRRQLVCGARKDYMQSCCDDLMPMAGVPKYPVPSDEIFVELDPRVAELERACRRFRDLQKQRLEMGPLDMGDGKSMILKPYELTPIDPLAAWPILTSHFDSGQLNQIIKIGKTELGKQAASRVAKGQGAKAKRELMKELDEAGAITRETHHKRASVNGNFGRGRYRGNRSFLFSCGPVLWDQEVNHNLSGHN
jgi:hypothetical protein